MAASSIFTGRTWVSAISALALAATLMGCSMDRHVYRSTVDLPTTISIEDPYNNQSLWQMDIPVGLDLTIDFDREGELEVASVSGLPATSMQWKLIDQRNKGIDHGAIALPGTPVVIRVTYRPAPEYPQAYTGPRAKDVEVAQQPAPQPMMVEPLEPLEEPAAPVEQPVEQGDVNLEPKAATDSDTVQIDLDDTTVQIDVDAAVRTTPKLRSTDELADQPAGPEK